MLCTYRNVWLFFFVYIGRKQNLVDHMEDPVNADVVAVSHVSLVDEDASLKISNIQTVTEVRSLPTLNCHPLKSFNFHSIQFKH